jgi:hypothetical protein
MIIYSLIFIYFFADPILCQGETQELIKSQQPIQEAIRESANLNDLKANLESDIKKYNEFRIAYYQ